MSRFDQQVRRPRGIAALALGAMLLAGCSSVGPLSELSRTEQAYFQRLGEHLTKKREQFEIAVNNRWNEDVLIAQAMTERSLAEIEARREVLALENGGAARTEAWRIAGERYVVAQRRIALALEQAQREREEQIKELLALYDAVCASVVELAKNQAKLGEYLELGWIERLVVDVKGLDRAELKRLGDKLGELRSVVGKRRSES